MNVQPYLNFSGRCEEALEFYRKALGAEVLCAMRFSESPDQSMVAPEAKNKIMHAAFKVGDTEIFASDGRITDSVSFQGFSLTIKLSNIEQAEKLFAAVGEGGQVQMPLTETFFSPRFGMVADRFGISWMILVEQSSQT